jgi:hypothetical protein
MPVLAIIANIHIPTTTEYPVCSMGPEDVKQLMFTCDRAMEVCRSLDLKKIINDAASVDRSGSIVL